MSTTSGMDKLAWYWHRLRAMEPAEIAVRVASKARQWGGDHADGPPDSFSLGPPAACPRLPDARSATAELREAARRAAEELRAGRWRLFASQEVMIEGAPRWHRDPIKGLDLPVNEGARPDHRALPGGASARAIWEVNRWAEMVILARNAWLNDAPDDARLAQSWVEDWCDKNATGDGINWCGALEAAIRLINFCWMDALVRERGDAELIETQDRLAKRVVPDHALWIWRHRSPGSSANNHLIGELAAMVVAARRWPALVSIACCAERAWDLLRREVPRQFAEDGGNREQALHYHLFAWEWLWHAHRAMRDADTALGAALARGAQFFADCSHAQEPWDFGDSDDAQIVPVASSRERSTAEWAEWMRGDAPSGAVAFWLGQPPAGIRALPADEWKIYPRSGIAIQARGAWKARLDASPLGFGGLAAHGHLDALHLSLWHGEHAVVIDPGTGGYHGDEALRADLASWEWHNGPVPKEGRERPHRAGTFLWRHHHDEPRIEVGAGVCRASLACDGPLVRRAVSFENDAWKIEDDIVTAKAHVVRWRLSPSWSLRARVGDEFRFAHESGKTARLSVESAHLASASAGSHVVSPEFGRAARAPVVTIEFARRLVSRWKIG